MVVKLFCLALMGLVFSDPSIAQVNSDEIQASPQSRMEFYFEHTNDMDIFGGNDEGFTFGNKMGIRHKSSEGLLGSGGPSEIFIDFGTRFFTQKKHMLRRTQDLQEYWDYERDENGRIFQNYLEEYRMSCDLKLWDREARGPNALESEGKIYIRSYWKLGCDFVFETTDQTDTGVELQSEIHDMAGLNATNATTRVYNYSMNAYDYQRFGAEVSCHRGVSTEIGDHLTCAFEGGLTAKSFGFADSSLDASARIDLHTQPVSGFNRDRPTFGIFTRLSCRQYFDLENRDSELGIGLQAHLGSSERGERKYFCEAEFIKPFEVNDEIWRTGNDTDNLLRIQMGIKF